MMILNQYNTEEDVLGVAIGIYKIQNKLNNKIYIGQSIDIARR